MEHVYSEKIRSQHTPVQYDEICDKDKNNNCTYKSIVSIAPPSKNGTEFTHVDEINESFRELTIESCIRNVDWDQRENGILAGKISKVIASLNIILVQPSVPDVLLDIETPLFLSCTSMQNGEPGNNLLLGYVDDIFGSIGEPMYSVHVTHSHAVNIFAVGKEVYYFPGVANTQLVYVEQTANKTFNNIRYNIKSGTFQRT